MKLLCSGLLASLLLAGCQKSPQCQFSYNLATLCGQSLTGSVVSDDPQDADWRKEALIVGPVKCADDLITMPLAVGENKSRTWFVSQSTDSLTLKHRHTLEDGSLDPVTNYGGTTAAEGTATRQDFPADQHSKDVFLENNLDVSVTNVWTLEIKPGEIFAYELNREGRHFRAEFPLK